MKKLIVIGAGGHAKVIIDIALKRKDEIVIEGILDDGFSSQEKKELFGIPVIGKIEKISELSNDIYYVIAIGSNRAREEISRRYLDIKYITLIHPSAVIGDNVMIDIGTVIMANSTVNPYSSIGKHCILNTGCIVEHDNIVEDYVHLSPRATLCGTVRVKKGSWIGAGSTIIQTKIVGKNSIVGAGSVVIENIPDNCTAVGNPSKMIKNSF